MSRMPKVDKKPKNNKSNKFRWVDSQWEKMLSKIDKLEQENLKLQVALCNLRDEYLNIGGDPSQLELFDKDDPRQISLDFEIEQVSNNDFEVKKPMIYESPDGGKTIYGRRAGDSVREQFNRECD
tara:strand:- start:80 stop:454 length:375 start_codon:yes stop_codon:yes gene_type:complete